MKSRAKKPKVGKRLLASRLQRGLPQTVVARRAGIEPSYLSRIETGRVHPTVGMAMRIAAALRTPLGEVLGPSEPDQRGRPCPVSPSGHCLMDLLDAASRAGTNPGPNTFSRRQIRLLRRFTALVQQSDPKLLRALEVLVGEVLEARRDATGSSSHTSERA